MSKVNIFWFRRDLRLQDNIGLYRCSESDKSFIPVFIFDQSILKKLPEKSDSRVQFIHNTLVEIKEKLQEYGSDLRVYLDTPKFAFKRIIEEFDIEGVYTNEDYEPEAIKRDLEVSKYLEAEGISFFQFKDQCIFAKNDILKKDGKPYTVYTPFKNKWLESLKPENIISVNNKKNLKSLLKIKPQKMLTLDDIGFQKVEVQNNVSSIKKKIINEYTEKRDFPAQDATSRLGLHLRFGTVSIRKCVQVAYHADEKTWLSQLIWREFFMQILYHFPHVQNNVFKAKYENIKWLNNKSEFKKWCEGITGYPLVDAGMRELNATGFMHNRVRMVTASFLIKHLLIDWRWGEKYFAKHLLDYELAANNGNWQWVAGTGCDSAPYFRIFNPETQLKKFDPDLEYVKRWVPEFGTKKYPEPMIDHKMAYNRALLTYKIGLK
jgi:deoxyribodipyrimidine photo-lyase